MSTRRTRRFPVFIPECGDCETDDLIHALLAAIIAISLNGCPDYTLLRLQAIPDHLNNGAAWFVWIDLEFRANHVGAVFHDLQSHAG